MEVSFRYNCITAFCENQSGCEATFFVQRSPESHFFVSELRPNYLLLLANLFNRFIYLDPEFHFAKSCPNTCCKILAS